MVSRGKFISSVLILLFLIAQIPLASAAEEESIPQDIQTFASLQYDANGNLIKGWGKQYEYNSENQLVKIKDAAGFLLAQYTYDHEGNRIKKYELVDGTYVVTYYPDENFVQEIKGGLQENTAYYYFDGQLIARKDSSGMYYYHPDHLGSTTLVTDASGKVVEEEYYLPFGASPDYAGEDRAFSTGISPSGGERQGGLRKGGLSKIGVGKESRYLYTGKEKDASGLYYYGARHYDAFTGHFIQPDSIIADVYNPQNLNRYSYALNNPYKYTDSSGNYVETAFDIGFIIYDIHELKNNFNVINSIALTADVVGAALPFATGGGLIVRGVTKVSKVDDAAKVASKSSLESRTLMRTGKIEVNSFKEADRVLKETFPTAQKFPGASPLRTREEVRTLRETEKDFVSKGGISYRRDYLINRNTGKIYSHEGSIAEHATKPHINIEKKGKPNTFLIVIEKIKDKFRRA